MKEYIPNKGYESRYARDFDSSPIFSDDLDVRENLIHIAEVLADTRRWIRNEKADTQAVEILFGLIKLKWWQVFKRKKIVKLIRENYHLNMIERELKRDIKKKRTSRRTY